MTERIPFIVYVVQDVVVAMCAQDLGAPKAGNPLGGLVPVSNLPVPIHEVDAVIEIVENSLVEGLGLLHEIQSPLLLRVRSPSARRLEVALGSL